MSDWIEGKIVGKRHWSEGAVQPADRRAAGGLYRRPVHQGGAGRGRRAVGRPYSLVNAPTERPLEIYFNEIPEGPLTPKLSDLVVGDRVWVADKASGVFTLDNVVSRRHLWMLATGTALGVYLSMLKTADAWERFERVILVHGARNAGELSYGETIAEIQAAHEDSFTFITALTRDASETALQGRITNLLENGSLQAVPAPTSTPTTAT
jgi:ferredoxin--NADP+ reductase